MLGNIIGGFIVILVGVTLAPTVADEVAGAQNNSNISGASDTILGLTTLFYNLSIASTAIGERSNAHKRRNPFMRKPEYRLTSPRGQDRGENHKNFAVETDKGFHQSYGDGMRYSPNSKYNMKLESNNMIAAQGETITHAPS